MRHIFVKQGFSVLVITMMAVMGAPRSETRETRHPAVKVLCIPAPAFEMQTNDVKYTNTGVLSLNDGWGYVRAPLILPNNTKIKKVEMVCKDNGSLNLRMWIHTISNDLSQNFTLCEVDSSGASSTYETFSTTVISPNVHFMPGPNSPLIGRLKPCASTK